MRVLTTLQMREADRRTIEDVGVPSVVLMENAGRQVVSAMESGFDALDEMRVAVLCGRGNNGGDGFVVARMLAERGIDVGVYLLGRIADVKGDARTNLNVLSHLAIDVVEVGDAAAWELHGSDVLARDLIVDALLGTGLAGPLSGLIETVVADVNASPRPVVAIDIPSGLSADTPDVPGTVIDATMTVTLGAPKLPLVLPPAEPLAGDLVIADIGIPRAVIDSVDGPQVHLVTRDDVAHLVEPRPADSHKGDYGRVLIVGGASGRSGAVSLAGMAALRSGAGLVTVAAPRRAAAVVAALAAEYMTLGLDEDDDGGVGPGAIDQVLGFDADVVAIGPGLGRSPAAVALVHTLVDRSGASLVLDADALNAFEGEADRLLGRDGIDVVITPHPGEMARLSGLSVDDVQAHRLDVARDFAVTHRLHVVLKGHRTVLASPDGKTSINLTGNPGMATAGAGDVLTGVTAAWLAQLLDVDAAVRLAVYLHGLAGDLAEAETGEVALVAGDLVARLGAAVRELTGRRRVTPERS